MKVIGSFSVGCCLYGSPLALDDDDEHNDDNGGDDSIGGNDADGKHISIDIGVEIPSELIQASDVSNGVYIDKRNVWLRTLASQLNDSVELATLRELNVRLRTPFAFCIAANGGVDAFATTPCVAAKFATLDAKRYAFSSIDVRIVPCVATRVLTMQQLAPLVANVPALPNVPSPRLNAAMARDAATLRHAAMLQSLCSSKRGHDAVLGDGMRRALVLWRLLRRRRTTQSFDLPSGSFLCAPLSALAL